MLDPVWVKELETTLPELPDAKKARLQSQYGLTAYDAQVLITEQARADFYEAAANKGQLKGYIKPLLRDLSAAYEARLQGTEAALPLTDTPAPTSTA